MTVMTVLHPKPKKVKPKKPVKVWVDYVLTYDGGYSQGFTEEYKTVTWARIHAWYLVHIQSWGWSAIMFTMKE